MLSTASAPDGIHDLAGVLPLRSGRSRKLQFLMDDFEAACLRVDPSERYDHLLRRIEGNHVIASVKAQVLAQCSTLPRSDVVDVQAAAQRLHTLVSETKV